MAKPPNILFIFADQMRGMEMGCAGNAAVATPNMDLLAAQGARLPCAYANLPVCTPSRAILLTGRYPLQNRVVANDLPIPEDVPSIGKSMRAAGYRTGYIGKWHLDGVPRDRFTPSGPRRHGFDHWAVYNCSHRYMKAAYYHDDPGPIPIEGYEPVRQTDLALEFLADPDPRPFCLFLSWGPPHDPYREIPDERLRLYDPARIPLRPNVKPLNESGRALVRNLSIEEAIAGYYAHITALDGQIGRLIDALDASGRAQDTILVFTSDHGDMLGSQGMAKKQQPWEESINIPFLIRWPGRIAAASVNRSLLSVVDFAPTLLGLAGLPPLEGQQGSDLSRALLENRAAASPDSVFLADMVPTDEAAMQGLREWRGVRTRRHTYARWRDGSPWILYDNETDPFQMDNLAGRPEFAALRHEMEALLQSWLIRLDDPFLAWQDQLRSLGLADLWNARERELHKNSPLLI